MGHRGNDKLVQPWVGLNLKSLKDMQVELFSREGMQIGSQVFAGDLDLGVLH